VSFDSVLATLASYDDREVQLNLVLAQRKEAEAQRQAIELAGTRRVQALEKELEQLKATEFPDVSAQEAQLVSLEEQKKHAEDFFQRLQAVSTSSGGVSPEEVNQARLRRQQAESAWQAADFQLQKTRRSYKDGKAVALAKIAAAEAENAQSKARVPSVSVLDRQLEVAERSLEATRLKAPIAGTVLKINSHPGEPTGNLPILYLADLHAMTAIAEVSESDIDLLDSWLCKKVPVQALINRPGVLGKTLNGIVDSAASITRMVGRNQVYSLNPREDADRRVFEVHVRIAPEDQETAAQFVGLQVDVELLPPKKP